MKKNYIQPATRTSSPYILRPIAVSLNGDTGEGSNPIGYGGEDEGGGGDPDAKQRGGLEGWGNLW